MCAIAVCWKDTSGVCEQHCVVMRAPEAWVCTGMAVRGRPRLSLKEIRKRPPPTPQPCAPSVSMVLLSDDPKGCEHGALTSQSSPSQSPDARSASWMGPQRHHVITFSSSKRLPALLLDSSSPTADDEFEG